MLDDFCVGLEVIGFELWSLMLWPFEIVAALAFRQPLPSWREHRAAAARILNLHS